MAKRALDVLLSAFGLLLSAPLWLLLAAAIRWEDGGPVFFTQERVGRGGELFRSYKFRSMRVSGEGADGIDGGGEAEVRQAAAGDDPRVTRVGQWMRATAMDELPQLVNILKGDMSFVGPRPLAPREVEAGSGGRAVELETLPGYEERHRIRPGLTGLAQVRALRDLPHRKKFRYDLLYVRERSFCLDLRLIAESVLISLTARWPEVGRG